MFVGMTDTFDKFKGTKVDPGLYRFRIEGNHSLLYDGRSAGSFGKQPWVSFVGPFEAEKWKNR